MTTAIPPVDAYYLYNPFEENLYEDLGCLDRQVELSQERFERDIRAVERLLVAAPRGTCLVTYNGFGGRVPTSYQMLRVGRGMPSPLYLWRKLRATDGGPNDRRRLPLSATPISQPG